MSLLVRIGVRKIQRFEIANIDTDVLLGRDFFRTHSVAISYSPDTIVARDLAGSWDCHQGS
jgi:hypothetical protein